MVTTGATIDIAIWTTIEMSLAISAASLSTLRPLVKAIGWKFGLTSERSGEQYGASSRRSRRSRLPNLHNVSGNKLGHHVYIKSEFSQDKSMPEGDPRWKIGTQTTAYAVNSDGERHGSSGCGTESFECLAMTGSDRGAEEGYASKVSPKYFLY